MYVSCISPLSSKSILDFCGWFLTGIICSLHQEDTSPSRLLPTEVWAHQRTAVWSLTLRWPLDQGYIPSVVFPGEQGLGHSSTLSSLEAGVVWSEGRSCNSGIAMGGYLTVKKPQQFPSFKFSTSHSDSWQSGIYFQPLLVSHQHLKQAPTTSLYPVIKCLSFFS